MRRSNNWSNALAKRANIKESEEVDRPSIASAAS